MMEITKIRLFLSDFDGTVLNTFEQSPSGYGVHEAYQKAIQDIFGEKALKIFSKIGLKNRTPGEVVKHILGTGNAREILEFTRLYFQKDEIYKFENLVPDGKGVKLSWNEENPYPLLAELLVRVKLFYLMKNIGSKMQGGGRWPRIYPGVSLFLKTLRSYSDFGIVSSGHDIFIQKCFDLYEIEHPKVMITDDDVRGLNIKDLSKISKPSPYLIHLALKKWGLTENPFDSVVYTGDDIEKDGIMAKRAGVPFIHFNEVNKNHWYDLAEKLQKKEFPFD